MQISISETKILIFVLVHFLFQFTFYYIMRYWEDIFQNFYFQNYYLAYDIQFQFSRKKSLLINWKARTWKHQLLYVHFWTLHVFHICDICVQHLMYWPLMAVWCFIKAFADQQTSTWDDSLQTTYTTCKAYTKGYATYILIL